MFENLTEKLQRAFKNLRGQGKLAMDQIRTICFEIKRRENAALHEANLGRQGAGLATLLATLGASLVLLFFFAAGLEPIFGPELQVKDQSRLLIYGAAILASNRFGIAIAAIIRMIATTISNSINEKPLSLRIFFPRLGMIKI